MGTVTEIYDYLRLLFARAGRPHCPNCGKPITRQAVEQMVDHLTALGEGTRLQILSPLVRGKKGEHIKVFEEIRRNGFVRVRVDGEVLDASEEIRLDKNKKHTIEVVVDRIILRPESGRRLADSLETALKAGGGVAIAALEKEEITFSENFACVDCGISISEISPRLFSFNSPYGACPECTGLGIKREIDPDLVIPDRRKSIAAGAIQCISTGGYYYQLLEGIAAHYGFSLDTPVEDLAPEHLAVVLYGTRGKRFPFVLQNDHYGRRHEIFAPFEGIINNLSRRHRETNSEHQREELEQYMSSRPCPACRGARLKPEALAVKVGDRSITEITRFSVLEAQAFFHGLQLTGREEIIARQVLKEIQERLGFLINVGLDYLTLDRGAGTLSGGEAQRIRLATQIGSGLMGVLYILDEPSIGLHQRDNQRLLRTLERLRDLGNTLIVVEHDEDTMLAADHIIDIGPGAGEHGGRVVATGTYRDIMENPESVTGQYLCGKRVIPAPQFRRRPNGRALEVLGACENNLKNIDVVFPLNLFTCVTGVSGSGKSTLVNDILYRKLAQELHRARTQPGRCREVRGIGHLDKVIDVNQSPIGRTPRSNPATYTGVFNDIRDLFAQTPESKMRGYKPGRFSFNVKGGRCEACQGDGIIKSRCTFAGCLCALRGLQAALQPGNHGGPLQAQKYCRRTGYDRGACGGIFPPHSPDPPQVEHPLRCGPGLYPPGTVRHHPVRRRGPAGEAGHGAVPALQRKDLLHPGRAHHRPARRRHRPAAEGAAPAGGSRGHGCGH